MLKEELTRNTSQARFRAVFHAMHRLSQYEGRHETILLLIEYSYPINPVPPVSYLHLLIMPCSAMRMVRVGPESLILTKYIMNIMNTVTTVLLCALLVRSSAVAEGCGRTILGVLP